MEQSAMQQIGRYRIVGELGRGAMGVVYHATDPAIGRSVAIKTIRIRDINDTQERDRLRERLFREARSAGVLSHPNIVTIYDMDEVEGLAYIAMAYVNGPTLEKILAAEEPLSGARMLRILRQAASALDYAHAKGIVHRDVKPANIMTDEDGAVKIADFGIAKIIAGLHATDTKSIAGTPNYMSPEQVQGLSVEGRSDQFSLAVIAYEILTGERPFVGEHLSTIVYKIVADEPPAAHRLNGTLTEQIDAVLRRGLAKKAEDRFPDCSSFVGSLEVACAESRGWKTLPSGASSALPTVGTEVHPEPISALPPPPPPRPPAPRHRSPFVPLLLSLLVVLGLASLVLYQLGGLPGQGSTEPAAPKSVASESLARETPVREQPIPEPVPDPAPYETPNRATVPAPAPEASEQAPPAKTVPDDPPAARPSPMAAARVVQGRAQDVWVTTNPPGARAALDDRAADSCRTPCMLRGVPGVHRLSVSQAGYQNEYREVRVADSTVEVPPITLREPMGTLWLSTVPSGARILIDGKPTGQTTSARISLPPGSYMVTVEKNGASRTERVQLRDGTLYLKIPLSP